MNIKKNFPLMCTRIAQSVQPLSTGWTVEGSNPGEGEIFRTHPDGPWATPSLLYYGYRVFTEGNAVGAWRLPPNPSSAEVKERIQLYFLSPSGSSWPVIGCSLRFYFLSRDSLITSSGQPSVGLGGLSGWVGVVGNKKNPLNKPLHYVTKCDTSEQVNPLNPELNPICYLLALLGAHHFLHVNRTRLKLLTFRRLMSYIYIYIYIWSTHS